MNWTWELYDEAGNVIHAEKGFNSREDAEVDFRSYKMALQSDNLWSGEYLVHFDRLPEAA